MRVLQCLLNEFLSVQERKLFDEKFIRLDTRRLCELTSAADALDMKPLVDLTSRALARMIEGKSAEEIRWDDHHVNHCAVHTSHLVHVHSVNLPLTACMMSGVVMALFCLVPFLHMHSAAERLFICLMT